ncbi:hypothetical protein ENSA5_62110 [Enhygromyxa salina]|uniref:Aromatic ring-opening dioxygenase LigA n=1 Tax=Enhygromyxa salina TaxID=215803 RepID=A0A2S9XD53_9BACT|nr:hypothetical protein [Enhygromyxa salina]PRP90777.1 hypothetical protein ENSA5_62110 [Enhygromyxa salina]
MDIRLKFINRSSGGHQAEVVLFQRNILASIDELPLAWKVIRYCGRDCYHPLVYPTDYEVSTSDEYGNHSPRVRVANGQQVKVTPTPSGRRLGSATNSDSSAEIQVINALPRGSVNVNIYKAGLLMARKTAVAPGQKVVFQFKPTLWISVASQIMQSEAVTSAVIASDNTELPLAGFTSADIVMTGGGSGSDAAPYVFTLENMRLA